MEDRIVDQSARLDLVTKVTSSKGNLWLAPTPW
jgi:hypothetical protein